MIKKTNASMTGAINSLVEKYNKLKKESNFLKKQIQEKNADVQAIKSYLEYGLHEDALNYIRFKAI